MLIKRDILEAIKRGDIDLQFRRWSRATVKPGGTLKTAVGILNIGEINELSENEVELKDAKRAGFADLEDFRQWLATMKPGYLCKIELSYAGEDPLIALRERRDLSMEELAEVDSKLDAMDKRAPAPWTTRTLELIAQHPGRLASELADMADKDKAKFKADVAKLKALGLTISFDQGYRLSPRGATVFGTRLI
ncbi:MAG: hypothetical protein KDJ19_04115 [Hyphomicrobiaceae bacterium]|nr:hypothetical protein [Hyphomicrobiaceae bacterium]MCC0022953.1 hypothetical protein [Hyphomicrobiaceae bacterium]